MKKASLIDILEDMRETGYYIKDDKVYLIDYTKLTGILDLSTAGNIDTLVYHNNNITSIIERILIY